MTILARRRSKSPRIVTVAVNTVLALLVGCGNDGAISGNAVSSEPLQGDRDPVTEAEIMTPLAQLEPNTRDATEQAQKFDTTSMSKPNTDQRIAVPSTIATDGSTAPQLHTDNALRPNEEEPSNREQIPNEQERADSVNPSISTAIPISIPILDEVVHASSPMNGEPFRENDPVPVTIIASTTQCDLVSIDTLTSQSASIWDYAASGDRDFDCQDSHVDEPSGESLASYVDNLEWIDPNFLLVSLCCEPAVGRFELIDTSNGLGPSWLALNGGSPSLNEDNVLLYSLSSHVDAEGERVAISSMAFDVHYDESVPDYPFYGLKSEPTLYALSFGPDNAADIVGFISELSWVGEDKIAFELWTRGPSSNLHPFIGLIDIESNSAIFGSSKDGWSLPSGDASSNLVVVEQTCNWVDRMHDSCTSSEAKIVVLDSNSLAPTYEIAVNDNVVDMDLHRGWLLVTFSSGQMGILDLVDGSFSAIADGVVNAVWAE